ncbi:hypothetical protein CQA53_01320 [Helicobacter didelphidarum]|uniref:Outer membrane beta-barrel protein n=1 Tax=Helicobacter didelphidarum TaxID=2040648 RepID=A0A3D8IQV2_9HELI|nr:hypothetical protein [Helicobacter didelphidarum]RDU67668.1 hypothetical protein CQA53_01320 [Helicobacter didelphidarum]
MKILQLSLIAPIVYCHIAFASFTSQSLNATNTQTPHNIAGGGGDFLPTLSLVVSLNDRHSLYADNESMGNANTHSITQSETATQTQGVQGDVKDSQSQNTQSIVGDSTQSNGKLYSFGAGIGYGFDSVPGGLNHKTSLILSPHWENAKGWILDAPFILSYIAPNPSYFQSYFNNIGDGANIDISALVGKKLLNAKSFGISASVGLGYSISYMWASRERLVGDGRQKDVGTALYNALTLRAGVEGNYKKHVIGAYTSYYMPLRETLKLLSTGASANSPQTNLYDNTIFSSYGINAYYLYRF